MRKTILLVLLFVSPTLSSNNPSSTLKCLKKASYGSCKVFIRCCNFICQEQVSVAAIGSSFLSQPGLAFSRIHRTRQSSLSKLDWIAGVFLLFIIDMLFLSLSL
uniref:Secreted protein n=1 Tax=Rhabditophanes sp. KR3021 TaxID=114890 RepID=A0AC35TWK4_9BILA